MFKSLDIGASGLAAQRMRLDAISSNVANVNTTRDAAGNKTPYLRRVPIFSAGQAGNPNAPGVHVSEVQIQKPDEFIRKLEKGHRDADAEGWVSYPNINLPDEFVNALEASRAYEANITMMETSKAMINASLRLIA